MIVIHNDSSIIARHTGHSRPLFAGKEEGMFDVCIVNDDLEDAYGKLKDALLEVSRVRGGTVHPHRGVPSDPAP